VIVRINGSWGGPNGREWAGALAVGRDGHIERGIDLPEEAFQAIERALAGGGSEGTICLADGARFDWALQPDAPPRGPEKLDAEQLQVIAARDQLWASLRPLLPEIDRLAEGGFDGSDRQRQMAQLLARIVANELRFRAGDL
jgi:hypothetical protein